MWSFFRNPLQSKLHYVANSIFVWVLSFLVYWKIHVHVIERTMISLLGIALKPVFSELIYWSVRCVTFKSQLSPSCKTILLQLDPKSDQSFDALTKLVRQLSQFDTCSQKGRVSYLKYIQETSLAFDS